MAPRKDASDAVGIDSFDLPKALVTRLAKSALPAEAKLQKDTVTALVRGATVFINYLAATAQDIAAARSRRTIASGDVLAALEVLALGDLVPLLQRELDGYRGEKENKNKGSVSAKTKDVVRVAAADAQEQEETDSGEEDDDAPEDNDADAGQEEVEDDPAGEEERLGALPYDVDMPDAKLPSDDAEEEEEEIEDTVALEKEELRRDGKGLEEDTGE